MIQFISKFQISQKVFYKRYPGSSEWQSGEILKVSFTVSKIFYTLIDRDTCEVSSNIDENLVNSEPNSLEKKASKKTPTSEDLASD